MDTAKVRDEIIATEKIIKELITNLEKRANIYIGRIEVKPGLTATSRGYVCKDIKIEATI